MVVKKCVWKWYCTGALYGRPCEPLKAANNGVGTWTLRANAHLFVGIKARSPYPTKQQALGCSGPVSRGYVGRRRGGLDRPQKARKAIHIRYEYASAPLSSTNNEPMRFTERDVGILRRRLFPFLFRTRRRAEVNVIHLLECPVEVR